jgi:hypothetical protein
MKGELCCSLLIPCLPFANTHVSYHIGCDIAGLENAYVNTLKTEYPRMQALSQDEGQDGRSCAPTCPVALAPASWLKVALEPPRVSWLQLPPPGSGHLQSRLVPRGSSSRLSAQGSFGAATYPMGVLRAVSH